MLTPRQPKPCRDPCRATIPSTADVVVIGASAGATPVLTRLAETLPADFPAILLVRHIGTHTSVLPDLLAGPGRMRARHAVTGDAVAPGALLVAPPDRHMLVADGLIRLTRGAKENLARPAVDPLFRSAAACFGPRVEHQSDPGVGRSQQRR